MTTGVDRDFISRQEGGRRLRAYVPVQRGSVIGHSGVTVATGVDLGRRSRTELEVLRLSAPLVEKLEPYLGLQRDAALAALRRKPLVLTPEEAEELDTVIRSRIDGQLRRLWNASSSTPFLSLPSQAQTVLTSLAYNFGPELPAALPNTWKAALDMNWRKVAAILRTASLWRNPELVGRRCREAALLEQLILQ